MLFRSRITAEVDRKGTVRIAPEHLFKRDLVGNLNSSYATYDKCRVTNLTRPQDNSYITLTCLVPDKQPGEEYDFWIKFSGYNYDYCYHWMRLPKWEFMLIIDRHQMRILPLQQKTAYMLS